MLAFSRLPNIQVQRVNHHLEATLLIIQARPLEREQTRDPFRSYRFNTIIQCQWIYSCAFQQKDGAPYNFVVVEAACYLEKA